MKKNDNRIKNLKEVFSLILIFLAGTAVCWTVICLVFNDADELFELLFSSKVTAEAVTLLIILWFFGALIGGIVTALGLSNLIVKSEAKNQVIAEERDELNQNLEEAHKQIKLLRETLGKMNKNYSNSASRVFDAIENSFACSENSSDTDDADEFLTMQDVLRAKNRNPDKK